MNKITKKLSKTIAKDLQPGESYVTAMFLQRSGQAGQTMGFALGGVVGSVVAGKMGNKGQSELVTDSGIAATWPGGPMLVGLTDRRVLAYTMSKLMGKPKQLATAVDRAQIEALEVQQGKLTNRVTMLFSDGTGRAYEAPKLKSGTDAFVTAFNG